MSVFRSLLMQQDVYDTIYGTNSITFNAKANGLKALTLFGRTEQSNLPVGYTQYDYLRSTGTQYIDLGYKGNGNTKVEVKFKYYQTSSATGSGRVFGSRTTSSSDAFAIGSSSGIVASTGNKVFWCYDGQSFYVSDNTFALDEWQTVVFSATEHTINGTTEVDDYNITTFETPSNLKLFAFDNNGTIGIGYVDIAYCKLWNNGVLVRDVIPAYDGTTYSMYDRVSGTMLPNAGTGDFVAGNTAVPTPDAPIDIVSNNGVVKARYQSGLPLGYTLLNYVVFDSTQVIDTGFIPDNNSRIESKCYRTGDDCWFYGACPSNPRITLYHSRTGTCRWGYQSRSNVGFVADTEYTIIEDKNGLNINGVDNPWTSGTADNFTCDRSLTIGNNNGSSGTRYFAGNFYYMKIYDNGVLARDFVPCKNASNVVGLYDVVNGVFYTDTGLVAGTTVSDPIEIYTDGTVETITDSLSNTATAEMLLKVGDYQDTQEVIAGNVTRNVGIKVLDGTENWYSMGANVGCGIKLDDNSTSTDTWMLCSHFSYAGVNKGIGILAENTFSSNTAGYTYFVASNTTDVNTFKQWLADQYNAGTPVIVVYSLASETSETVTPQALTTQAGTNTISITQASLSNLELEAFYKRSK